MRFLTKIRVHNECHTCYQILVTPRGDLGRADSSLTTVVCEIKFKRDIGSPLPIVRCAMNMSIYCTDLVLHRKKEKAKYICLH